MPPRVQSQSEGPTFTQVGFCSSHKKKIVFILISIVVLVTVICVAYYKLTPAQIEPVTNGPSALVTVNKPHLITDVRLPTQLKPYFYKLSLIPFLSPLRNFSIDGRAAIDLICKEATDRIVLNIKNISIHESSVKVRQLSDGGSIMVLKHEYDLDRDFYKVILNESLEPGKSYRLSLEYEAVLSDQLVGFYRSSYVDKATNETRWLGVTQFSPTDARRAFPCFDEPAFKAKYEISLGRMENMTSISNMNLLKSEPISDMPGWIWDHYAQTLPMSSYLVGFAVTDFIPRASNASLSKPKFQVWSRRDAINQTDYARDIGPRILTFFEKYFGIDFPLPKLDMIAVPDHRFSAMENWGLITYRELVLLFDPEYSSDSDKRKIAEVVGHELAHQWFGNLVTPYWWSDLWLKEGFASYVEYLGADHVEPDWKILDLFVINELQFVFRMDVLNNSHPISIPVSNPNQINQIFDAISYSKGCTIIRMMDHFLSHPTFKQGLTNYLNKWKYNNTKQDDLWESLTEQAHADGTLPSSITVAEIMDTWTLQKGFPVVHVQRDYDTGKITFNQSKFRLNPDEDDPDLESYKWYIPISYASPSFNADFTKTEPQFWIGKNDTTIGQKPAVVMQNSDWFIVNVQSTGYYRVNYDLENWHRIGKQLKNQPNLVHTVNQAQLIDDSMSLARASLLPYDVPLNLTLYLKTQINYLPWQAFFENLNHLTNMLRDKPTFPLLQNYVKSLLQAEYTRLGFLERETDSVLERSHRMHILDWACKIGVPECIENALQLYKNWMEGVGNGNEASASIRIPVNLRLIVYCNAIRVGGDEEWNFARNQYLKVNVASEKDRILTALACSKNTKTIEGYLNDAVTPGSFIRKQDSRNVLSRVGATDFGNSITFKFLQAEFPRIQKHFGPGLSIDKIINSAVAVKLNTREDLEQMEKFKEDNEGQFGFGERAVDEAIEIVKANIYWMEHNYESVVNWLETHYKNL